MLLVSTIMDDSGAAYTFVMIVVLIIIAALMYSYLIPSVNMFTKQLNKQIDKGEISEQTKVVYVWNTTFFYYSLGIGLIGFAVFAVVRAIEIAEAGGGGGGW
jgi:hypothetical protein